MLDGDSCLSHKSKIYFHVKNCRANLRFISLYVERLLLKPPFTPSFYIAFLFEFKHPTLLYEFFVKQCSTITTGSTIPTFLPQCDEILQDLIIDREKVLQLIRSLNSNKAHGWDGISAHMIKLCDSSIVEPLCLIFEKCIETGKYPSIWKKANIVPVHKKG